MSLSRRFWLAVGITFFLVSHVVCWYDLIPVWEYTFGDGGIDLPLWKQVLSGFLICVDIAATAVAVMTGVVHFGYKFDKGLRNFNKMLDSWDK